MKTANLSKVKDGLSAYVEAVRRGETVRILVRGRAVADIVPIRDHSQEDDHARLSDLERRGSIRLGQGPITDELLKPGPRVSVSVSELLVEERKRR